MFGGLRLTVGLLSRFCKLNILMGEDMRLHIHFGIHRTGTTSIHSTLISNLNKLQQNGILYPSLGVDHRHVRTAWQLISKRIDGEALVGHINKEVKPSTNMVILSSEDFSQLKDARWLQVLSEHFDLTASIYLRRQDLWLESWYNQNIKWPWDKRFSNSTPEFFLSKRNEFYWLDYNWLLNTIERYVDRKNIYAQVMEHKIVPDTTVDFIECIGLHPEDVDIKKPKNASLTKCQLDILRLIDLSGTKPNQRTKILRALNALDIDEFDKSKSVFSERQRKEILESYSDINVNVAKKYFGRSQLFLEPINFPSINKLEKSTIYEKYFPNLLKILSL